MRESLPGQQAICLLDRFAWLIQECRLSFFRAAAETFEFNARERVVLSLRQAPHQVSRACFYGSHARTLVLREPSCVDINTGRSARWGNGRGAENRALLEFEAVYVRFGNANSCNWTRLP